MISVKCAVIIAVGAFAAGSFFASPVPQAIASTIANDVQCTGCVGTADVAGNAITAAKIKDGEVKAPEIAKDAVGGSELQGVSKLLFGVCGTSELGGGWTEGVVGVATCTISGADTDDSVIAMLNGDFINLCYGTRQAWVESANTVKVTVGSDCEFSVMYNTAGKIAVIVYDK